VVKGIYMLFWFWIWLLIFGIAIMLVALAVGILAKRVTGKKIVPMMLFFGFIYYLFCIISILFMEKGVTFLMVINCSYIVVGLSGAIIVSQFKKDSNFSKGQFWAIVLIIMVACVSVLVGSLLIRKILSVCLMGLW
jgi:hypothetical protein